jgi:chloride channel 3/4/5
MGSETPTEYVDYMAYVALTVALATASSLLTMTTRTVFPGVLQIQSVDEDLSRIPAGGSAAAEPKTVISAPTVYYSAAGSGVAEVKVILSGFVLHVCSLSLRWFRLLVCILNYTLGISRVENLGRENICPHPECFLGT